MPRTAIALLLSIASLAPTLDVRADEAKPEKPPRVEEPAGVPKELQGFSGMLIGRLVRKDIERGELTLAVDHVPRVWRNNKARNPRISVGKTFVVNGIEGKWLDALLLIKTGETLELEAQHQRGDTLRFPGEWLKKVAPFKAENYPTPPDGFRGYQGMITGTIEQKRPESRELVVVVKDLGEVGRHNKAKKPESVVGKKIIVAGFWGRMQKPFDPLKKGDTIHARLLHRVVQSDHFSVVEVVQRVDAGARTERDRPEERREEKDEEEFEKPEEPEKFPADALNGFRGVLVGKVLRKDAEKGELVIDVERVPRVFRNNEAKGPQRARGHHITVRGVSGRFLDVLLLLKKDDRIELAAFHNRGEHMDFPGELLRKVPVERDEE